MTPAEAIESGLTIIASVPNYHAHEERYCVTCGTGLTARSRSPRCPSCRTARKKVQAAASQRKYYFLNYRPGWKSARRRARYRKLHPLPGCAWSGCNQLVTSLRSPHCAIHQAEQRRLTRQAWKTSHR